MGNGKRLVLVFSDMVWCPIPSGLFYFPFKIFKSINYQEKIKKNELLAVISTQSIALLILFLVFSAGG